MRFRLEAIRNAPVEYGVGAALALVKVPAGDARLRVQWARVEAYCDPAEDWHSLWLQFGALPNQQHPVFYMQPKAMGYEVGWNKGPAAADQVILATVAGKPMVEHLEGVHRIHFADGRLDLTITDTAVSLGDRGGYVATFLRAAVSQYGEIGRDWLGVYCEGSLIEVLVEVEGA